MIQSKSTGQILDHSIEIAKDERFVWMEDYSSTDFLEMTIEEKTRLTDETELEVLSLLIKDDFPSVKQSDVAFALENQTVWANRYAQDELDKMTSGELTRRDSETLKEILLGIIEG